MNNRKLNKHTQSQGANPNLPRLLGDHLCLNYINTIDGRISNHPKEFLTSYSELVRWGWHVGVVLQSEAEQLERLGLHRPSEAAEVLHTAIALREALYRIFAAVAQQALPEQRDLDALRQAYRDALSYATLTRHDDQYRWEWHHDEDRLEQMLWPLLQSAVELLTSADLQRVKQCPGCNDCGWLFLDTSKNGTRHWCSMEGCGSRAKMRRQYARKREAV